MTQEFKTAKGWTIFICIFAPFVVTAMVYMLTLIFQNKESQWWLYVFFVPFLLYLIGFAVFSFFETLNGKLIVDEKRIIKRGVFNTTELKVEEVKGFRMVERFIFIYPIQKELPTIKISKYYGNQKALYAWLYAHLNDLAIVQHNKDYVEILTNEEFGSSIVKRNKKLKQAKIVVGGLTLLAGIIAALLFFYPYPYEQVTQAALILPFVLFTILHYYKGLVKVNQEQGTKYPSILLALTMPAMMLMYRALSDFTILEYNNFWLPIIAFTLASLFIMFSATKELNFKKKDDWFIIGFFAFVLSAYAYGGVINVNCLYDSSSPQTYSTQVIDKTIKVDETDTYYLFLSSWGPIEKFEDYEVLEGLYKNVSIGDTVYINLKEGKLNIPWYFISEE